MKWDSRVLSSFWNFGNQADLMLQRIYHSSLIVDDKHLYIFGGLVQGENNEDKPTNTTLRYSLETGEHHLIAPQKESIVPLSHHSMDLVETSSGKRFFYIFGGKNDEGEASSTVYCFDIQTEKWAQTKISDLKQAQARWGHASTLVDGTKLFIFGGTNEKNKFFNDLLIIDTELLACQKAKTLGAVPSAREGHSQVLFGNQLFVFGGGNDTTILNDLYSLDIDTLTWKQIQIKGTTLPSKRLYHSAAIAGDKMLVFGGYGKQVVNAVMIFDIDKKTWELDDCIEKPKKNQLPKQQQIQPPLLHGHTATMSGAKMWIFGGKHIENFGTSVYMLETGIRGVDPIDVGRCTLSQDMLALLKDGTRADVTLATNDAEFNCHKAILRARCPIMHKECVKNMHNDFINVQEVINRLKQKYTTLLNEEEAKLLMTKPIRAVCLERVLQFIYSDTIPDLDLLSDQELIQISALAKLLELERLQYLANAALSALNDECFDLSIPAPTLALALKELFELAKKASPAKEYAAESEAAEQDEDDANEDDDVSMHEAMQEDMDDSLSTTSNSTSSVISKMISNNPLQYAYCDVIFSVGKSDLVCAHRSVLMARSAYFFAVLAAQQSEYVEQDVSKQDVRIDSIRTNIFKLVLEYLYTGTCHIKFDNALELLLAAEEFEIERLSLMCQAVIERRLHVYNVCKIFTIADSYDLTHLRDSCIHFMIHHLSQIRRTPVYKEELSSNVKCELKTRRRELRHAQAAEGIAFAPSHNWAKPSTKKKKKTHKSAKKTTLPTPARTKSVPITVENSSLKRRSNSSPSLRKATVFSDSIAEGHAEFKSFGADDDTAYLSTSPYESPLYSISPTFNVDYYKQTQHFEQVQLAAKNTKKRTMLSKSMLDTCE